MNIKLKAVNALRFVRRYGMTCANAGTRGLVRLADGTVEEQHISWSRRGKVILDRRVVGKDEMSGFTLVSYLEDGYKPDPEGEPVMQMVMLKNREPVRGQPQHYCYLDDANFRVLP